jgi:hypothetical protein
LDAGGKSAARLCEAFEVTRDSSSFLWTVMRFSKASPDHYKFESLASMLRSKVEDVVFRRIREPSTSTIPEGDEEVNLLRHCCQIVSIRIFHDAHLRIS